MNHAQLHLAPRRSPRRASPFRAGRVRVVRGRGDGVRGRSPSARCHACGARHRRSDFSIWHGRKELHHRHLQQRHPIVRRSFARSHGACRTVCHRYSRGHGRTVPLLRGNGRLLAAQRRQWPQQHQRLLHQHRREMGQIPCSVGQLVAGKGVLRFCRQAPANRI